MHIVMKQHHLYVGYFHVFYFEKRCAGAHSDCFNAQNEKTAFVAGYTT